MGRFTNLVYYWATYGADPKDIATFDQHLFRPPKGVAVTVGPWSPEAETAAFQSLRTQVKG